MTTAIQETNLIKPALHPSAQQYLDICDLLDDRPSLDPTNYPKMTQKHGI
ncbi:MAG TPA: hypothetical protein IGS53_06810 [Leptolyngbyaceae cyanobacterium M33_DOE_097]|nr:hypothetical protein [Leptolyngbyaceae cyanobacterium M33_DOE_097]